MNKYKLKMSLCVNRTVFFETFFSGCFFYLFTVILQDSRLDLNACLTVIYLLFIIISEQSIRINRVKLLQKYLSHGSVVDTNSINHIFTLKTI